MTHDPPPKEVDIVPGGKDGTGDVSGITYNSIL
jgi:hypothetical protein